MEVDGIIFDSKKEAYHYRDLKLREHAGEIQALELQPAFDIVINDQKICTYRADFRFFDIKLKRTIITDVKGFKTPVYRLKKKLMRAVHRIEIEEI